MCIVMVKDSDVSMPTKRILKNCFDNNRDGAGLMLYRNGVLTIDKGYMSFKALWKRLKKYEITDADKLILHFRWATHGTANKTNCHPFIVSDRLEDVTATHASCKMAIAHNGVLEVEIPKKLDISDTMQFTMCVLSNPVIKDNLQNADVLRLLSTLSIGSRLAIMDDKGNITTTGTWITEDTGLMFSNDGYTGIERYLGGETKAWYEINNRDERQKLLDELNEEAENYMEECLNCGVTALTHYYTDMNKETYCYACGFQEIVPSSF